MAGVSGTVSDISGASVSGATVDLRTPSGITVFRTNTSAEGRFEWADAPPGSYQLRVTGEGLEDREVPVRAPAADLQIVVQARSVYSRITVTTTRGAIESADQSPQISFAKDQHDIRKRPIATLGEALAAEPGVLVQQSTFAQVSPFLRGLTGYQVLNLVDGIRFNNSTFRSGPNQYLAYVEPHQAERIEALLGPASVQYGSDSLGGAINVVTNPPSFASEPRSWTTHGDFFLGGATADLSSTGSGRIAVASDKVYWSAAASGRKHNDLRAGSGHDSRNVYHRLFGLSLDSVADMLGSRQQDSGFRQYGLESKFAFRPREDHLLTFNYQRGVQDQVRGYKDLLGGLGRLQSDFDPQVLNWFYARYEKLRLGHLDSLTGTFSLNSQTDGSARRNLNFSDPLTRDWNRVNSWGYSVQGAAHHANRVLITFGGDIYDEHVAADRTVTDGVTNRVTRPRPLYPDGSKYQQLAAFSQASVDITPRLRATGGIRYTGIRFATREDRTFNIPQSSQWFGDLTFQSSVRYQVTSAIGIHALVSRGFRAPNLNDLGALGLNDLGYEVPASSAISAGALLSQDSGESALSKGTPLRSLRAESLMNYEFGVRLHLRRLYLRTQLFDSELTDPIVRRTLLFPAASVPTEIAGLAVTPLTPTAGQRAQGVVVVATSIDPRALKAFVNDGQSRYYGVESLAQLTIARRLVLDANYTYLVGRDLNPNRNIRRLPPQMGTVTLRYAPAGRRPWFEVGLAASGAQDRLSGGDRDDERIGASFRRADIASFFRGSRNSAYVDPATGVFLPTGESLLQIQNRVLPIGGTVNGVRITDDNSRVPVYLSTAGWATVGIRSGFPLTERLSMNAAVENLLDRHYRVHGSGIDSPGISAWVGVGYRF